MGGGAGGDGFWGGLLGFFSGCLRAGGWGVSGGGGGGFRCDERPPDEKNGGIGVNGATFDRCDVVTAKGFALRGDAGGGGGGAGSDRFTACVTAPLLPGRARACHPGAS